MTVKEFLTISSIATEPEVIRTKLDELKKPYQLGQYKTPDTLNDINLGELIGTATSNKSGLMSPKLYCAIPNSYVVNGATELKGKYVKIISVNDWNGSIINVKVSNYGNGSYFYIILCLATNNIGRWVSGKLIAGNISGFSFYRVDKSIYMFIPDSIPDLYVTLDASMGNVSYGEEYENTIDLSNPITIS